MTKEKKISMLEEWAWLFGIFKSKKREPISNVVTSEGNSAVEVTHFGKWT